MSQIVGAAAAGKAATKASAACVPCFKRKMKCDRTTPCSNCRRRRDQSEPCHYPATPSAASVADLTSRLEKLENYIRATGVDPDMVVRDKNFVAQLPVTPKSTEATPVPSGPKVVDKLTAVWPGRYTWGATIPERLPSPPGRRHSDSSEIFMEVSSGFTLFMPVRQIPALAYEYPSPTIIQALWRQYIARVHMVHKLFFEWQKAPLIEKACSEASAMTPEEHAFVLNLLFVSVTTLSEEQCQEILHKDLGKAVPEFQYLAEYASYEAGVPTAVSVETYTGTCMYLLALRNVGSVSPGMMAALTAVLIRVAERLGLHHDGTKVGMTATETEERRRLWWNGMSLDLTAGVLTGCVPMSTYGDWSTEAPGNYEDADFTLGMTEYPPQRDGLTGMSMAVLQYRVFNTGRQLGPDGKRVGMTWSYSKSLTSEQKVKIVAAYSADVQERFLRHCEPFIEHHVLLQLECKKMMVGFQWLLHAPLRDETDPALVEPERRDLLFELGTKFVEYQGFAMTSEILRPFVWHTKHGFMWPALVYSLIDVRHRIPGSPTLARFWDAIAKLYEKEYTPFRNLKTPMYLATAELILDTWTANVSDEQEADAPSFIVWLRDNVPSAGRSKKVKKQQPVMQEWAQFAAEDFSAEAFLHDLANTDWSFWDTF